jgi:hypothetical protein
MRIRRSGGVFDDGEDVLALSGQGDRLDEVDSEEGVCLAAQEVDPSAACSVGCGIDVLGLQDLPHRRSSDQDAEGREFAVEGRDGRVRPALAGSGASSGSN